MTTEVWWDWLPADKLAACGGGKGVMIMLNLLLEAGDPAAATEMGMGALLIQMLPLLLIVVVMYFMLIRPQRKREKQVQEMRSKIEVGDEIVTAGGIVGRVVSIRDDSIVLETGSDRSKIRIMRWAIQGNNTAHDSQPEVK